MSDRDADDATMRCDDRERASTIGAGTMSDADCETARMRSPDRETPSTAGGVSGTAPAARSKAAEAPKKRAQGGRK